jgi:drug/metabolite transporter (DMT)-like permease
VLKGLISVPRWIAVILALFVTLLWSSSYILNQWAFAEGIKPLTLAGLRYSLAALSLLCIRLLRRRRSVSPTPRPSALTLVGLGLAGYVVAQGMQYIGQYYVTPTQASMVLSVGNTLQVLLLGIVTLREWPGFQQGLGIALSIGGALGYYYPWNLGPGYLLGIAMILASGTGYALHLTANRHLLRTKRMDPADLVLFPMIVGAVALVVMGLLLEPFPTISVRLIGLLLWLGPINGALAFSIWTYSQRALQAFESSTINNSMLLQIAALDILLLGRELSVRAMLSLVCVGLGILIVQTAGRRSSPSAVPTADQATKAAK